MKYLNIIMLTTFVVIITACGGAEERKAAYLEKARVSMEAGDYDKARIELKNVLQIDPKDDASYFMLGQVFEQQKSYMKAFRNYTTAAELSPGNAEYEAKLGRFYLILGGDVDKAQEKLDIIQAADADSVHGLLLEAGIAVHNKEVDKAMRISKRVMELVPANIENTVLMVSLLNADKNYDESVRVLDDALSHNENHNALMMQKANVLFQSGRHDESESVLIELVDQDRSNYRNYMNLAAFYQNTGQVDKAESTMREAIASDPEDIERRTNLISYIATTRSTEAAIAATREQIKEVSEDGELRFLLAQMLVSEGNPAAAKKNLFKIIDLYPEEQVGIKSRLALAELAIKDGDVDAASARVEEAYAIAPNDSDVNMIKAQIAIFQKDYEQGIISLRTVIKDDPEKLKAYFLLGAAHNASGEPDQAADILDRAHKNNRGNTDNLLALSQFHLQLQEYQRAEAVIDDFLKLDANNYDALSIKANVLNLTGRRTEARDFAEKVVRLYPGKVNGYVQSVPGMLDVNDIEGATELLETGLEKTGNDLKILALYTRLMLGSNQLDAAVKRLESVIDAGADADVYTLLAKVYLDNGMTEKGTDIVERGLEKYPDNELFYVARARLHAAAGDEDSMLAVLDEGMKRAATTPAILALLAENYLKNGDRDRAAQAYRDSLAGNANNKIAVNNLAALLVDVDEPDAAAVEEAMSLAQKLEGSESPSVVDTIAWVHYHAGDFARAAELMKPVVEEYPDVQVFNYHYGMILHKSGDAKNAKLYLKRALDDSKAFPGRQAAQETLDSIT